MADIGGMLTMRQHGTAWRQSRVATLSARIDLGGSLKSRAIFAAGLFHWGGHLFESGAICCRPPLAECRTWHQSWYFLADTMTLTVKAVEAAKPREKAYKLFAPIELN